jgi:hypothetical protein
VPTADPLSLLRRGLLALLWLGFVGVLAELLLLEHYDGATQWIPLVLLAVAIVVTGWHWWSGRRASLRAFQVVMLLFVAAGLVGIALHIRGNVEFERELSPGLGGFDFWWEVLHGATPTLAPGTLVQFGLLGLLYAYRHPALHPPGS